MGTGETGTFSGSLKVITRSFPKEERTSAVGLVNSGTMLGSMIAPPLVVTISYFFGWKMAFLLPASLGIVWAVGWRFTYRVSANEERAVRRWTWRLRREPAICCGRDRRGH